jgi:hypothetical protein
VLVLVLSALKLLDVPNAVLAAILGAAVAAGATSWIVTRRRARSRALAPLAVQAASASPDSAPD